MGENLAIQLLHRPCGNVDFNEMPGSFLGPSSPRSANWESI